MTHNTDTPQTVTTPTPPAPCGHCRRCAIHDDPGGCLEVERWERENPEAAIASIRANCPSAQWRIDQLQALIDATAERKATLLAEVLAERPSFASDGTPYFNAAQQEALAEAALRYWNAQIFSGAVNAREIMRQQTLDHLAWLRRRAAEVPGAYWNLQVKETEDYLATLTV